MFNWPGAQGLILQSCSVLSQRGQLNASVCIMCFTLDQYILVEMALVRSSDRLVLYDNDRVSVITINKIGTTRVVKVEISMGKNMEMSRLTFEHKVDPSNTG